MLLRQRVRAKALEVRDELLAPGHQAAFLEDSGRDAAVDALDEAAILQPIHDRPGEKFDLPDVRRHQ